MNSLKAYDSGSSSGNSSDEEEEAPKIQNEELSLHLKKPSSSILSKSTVSVEFRYFVANISNKVCFLAKLILLKIVQSNVISRLFFPI